MRFFGIERGEVVGLLHPAVDAHTLGVSAVSRLLSDCGIRTAIAGVDVCRAAHNPRQPESGRILSEWIQGERISHLGFSYRLDPVEGAESFSEVMHFLKLFGLLRESKGPVRGIYFAGLPSACERVKAQWGDRVRVFVGDESAAETLDLLAVPRELIPTSITEAEEYERVRLEVGRSLIVADKHREVSKPDRSGYSSFGSRSDSLVARLDHAQSLNQPPLMRAHVGPYLPDRQAAIREYLEWCHTLAASGWLDVLSIGTSQLTQEAFGEDWGGRPNGGGVPIQTEAEYREVYEASRPMLVRTYAGCKGIPRLAQIHEATINIAWHALSFWWFSQIDGRGPLPVLDNLKEHFATLEVIAKAGKPFEPNIPHHFAFRGADDVTYVVSGVLAARAAKRMGIKVFVLQNMLNTPKSISGLQDLAKARVMLSLVRELEGPDFRVVYQPRAGLDYLSPKAEKAKAQLAAATMLMDDVEPTNSRSPEVIHVVSYSEGYELANPAVVDESIQITQAALQLKRNSKDVQIRVRESLGADLDERVRTLRQEVRVVLSAIEEAIQNPYTPEGLYTAMQAGFLPAPYLWEGREEFANATRWNSQTIAGSVKMVDEGGSPVSVSERLEWAKSNVQRPPLSKLRQQP